MTGKLYQKLIDMKVRMGIEHLFMGWNGILGLMISYSLYVNLPYCMPGCRLCRKSHTISSGLMEEYPAAVIQEMRECRQRAGKEVPVQSVYVGGGCPTRLDISHLTALLRSIKEIFELEPRVEVTLEAVPGTVPQRGFQRLQDHGVNRISLEWFGIYDRDLGFLGRPYRYRDFVHTVTGIRQAGIENLNLDLMFGIPGQEMSQWRRVVGAALSMEPEHLSAYSFHPEEDSLMNSWMAKGLIASPDPGKRAAMYTYLDERLQQKGYDHYELSSWARPGYVCQHNLRYWRSDPYLGFGAGAHGYVDGRRTQTVSSPSRYIQAVEEDGCEGAFPGTSASLPLPDQPREAHMLDFVFMGLHLIQEGVSRGRFYERFQIRLDQFLVNAIQPLVEKGLLQWTDESLKFTARGVEVAPRVLHRLVEESKNGSLPQGEI